MADQSFERDSGSHLLQRVRAGMIVYDRNDERVGTVADLYFGSSSEQANREGTGAATAHDPNTRGDTLLDDFARAFAPSEDIPEVLRNRLLHSGFIRVDAPGLLGSDKYILPEQIASVSTDRVKLNVSRDELIKRTAS
jgi:hypothetical protein